MQSCCLKSKITKSSGEAGLTLLELLLVMAILSVFVTISLITYPASQRRSRDTQRKSDLNQYKTALEVYANKNNGLYPRRSAGNGQPAHTILCDDLGFSSGECPKDPKDGTSACSTNPCSYRYQTESCGSPGDPCATQYVLWAALEQPATDDYWVVCSNGKAGEAGTSDIPPSGGNCPI